MQTLYDSLVRHQIYLQRYGNQQQQEISKKLKQFLQRSQVALSKIPADQLSENSLKTALQLILKDHGNTMDDIVSSIKLNLVELSKYEVDFNTEALQRHVNFNVSKPTEEQITSALYLSKMKVADGRYFSINEIFNQFGASTAKRLADSVSSGYVEGKSTPEIAEDLASVIDQQRHNTMTLARTMTNHTAATARKISMEENKDVLDGYKWVATLDSRTSILCGGLDGKEFTFSDQDAPMPPAHYNCRSTIVPMVKEEYTLGRDIAETRASKDGPVDGKLTYEDWLKRQPEAFQDDILGKDRADIFRQGKLSLDKFVDDRGKTLSLDSLKKLDSQFDNPIPTQPLVDLDEPIDFSISTTNKKKAKKFSDAIAPNLSPKTRLVVNKTIKPNLVASKTVDGMYEQAKATVTVFDDDIISSLQVSTHEYGHFIDDMLGDGVNYKSQIDDAFIKAFDDDRGLLGLDKDDISQFVEKYFDEGFERYKRKPTAKYYRIRPKSKDHDFETSLSDIFDAMSKGRIQDEYLMYGHGAKYYRTKDRQLKETFANLFALHGKSDETGIRARKYLPNLFREFDRILQEHLDGKL